uniref:Phytocyanin domain-containing protein n=1 Tax=Brassica campestris TaxID=3711 RepID=A0A3P5YDZ6_BRACM|nr:unnamed protein product [Brassica rapa]
MNCIDRMLDTAHLRPCATILQSGRQNSLTNQRQRKREMGMMSLSSVTVLVMILLVQVSSTQYKVGDLDSWGIPTDAKVYTKWPKSHSFKIGDSLLFLYPPSEDSMIQVTASNFKSCNTKDPILYMNDGNSLQPHPKRNLLLHQRTSWPLSKSRSSLSPSALTPPKQTPCLPPLLLPMPTLLLTKTHLDRSHSLRNLRLHRCYSPPSLLRWPALSSSSVLSCENGNY